MATVNIVWNVVGQPATEISFLPAAASFTAPVPVGTVLGQLSVQPAGWNGSIMLTGPDAALINIDATLHVVTTQVLNSVRQYNAVGTASP